MIRGFTKICYFTFGRLHDRNKELSLANVANLIQTNMQAIYLLSARGLCRVLRRTLQHDFAHYTNEDDLALKQARHRLRGFTVCS